MTNHHKQVLDCLGLEKVLVLLQPLKKTSSGSVLYRQIERLLHETESTQSKITRAYASLVLALIGTYRRQLPRESRLNLELKVVQQRLMPPISLNELKALQAYLKDAANILGKVSTVEEDVLRDALAPLLDDARPAEQNTSGIAPVAEQHRESKNDGSAHRASVEQNVTSVYRSRLDKQRREMEQIQHPLVKKVNEAREQQEGVATLLESALNKLKQMENAGDPDQLRRQLIDEMSELVTTERDLSRVLNDTQSLLNRVDESSERLRTELDQVRVLSLTDELTQLPNRRAFLRRLEHDMARSQRDKSALTLGILDLDYFKELNDRHGHHAGDEVLRTYAQDILSLFRRYDMVARYGGDEFTILLPSTGRDGAIHALSKIKNKAADSYCMYEGQKLPVPAFSAGLAEYKGGEVVQALIDRADRALYRAKQSEHDDILVDECYVPEEAAD